MSQNKIDFILNSKNKNKKKLYKFKFYVERLSTSHMSESNSVVVQSFVCQFDFITFQLLFVSVVCLFLCLCCCCYCRRFKYIWKFDPFKKSHVCNGKRNKDRGSLDRISLDRITWSNFSIKCLKSCHLIERFINDSINCQNP